MAKHVAIENPNEVAPATARSLATHARKMANHAVTTAGGLSPMTAQAMAFPFMVLTQCRNGSAPHCSGFSKRRCEDWAARESITIRAVPTLIFQTCFAI
ncbi:hypothetical protein ACIPSK_06760 [Rhizobium sp. LARHSG275]